MLSPEKFVKPADLFKVRRKPKIEPQSPMKCLNNFADPSPTKKLPTLLRNPFNQPVKRRLNLGTLSPNKRNRCDQTSPVKSPNKKRAANSRMSLQLDEDANLEPPEMKLTKFSNSPHGKWRNQHANKMNSSNQLGPCYQNDWKLRTKVRVNFTSQCKNWEHFTSSTHKRHSGTLVDDESPSKLNDKTISIEAIKNAATVYQHPYLSWLPLYPRRPSGNDNYPSASKLKQAEQQFTISRHAQAGNMMHRDWCESLDDLTNLLIDGRCPFFYICADNFNILFRRTTNHSQPQLMSAATSPDQVEAFITPLSYGMACELRRLDIKLNCDDDSGIENDSTQDGLSDVEDDENDNEASQILESLGISQNEISFTSSRRFEVDSNSQSTRSISSRLLASIEGAVDIRKLVSFLKSNRRYTINTMGDFACIPPTLLCPREFRLSTPQYPEIRSNRLCNAISNGTSSGHPTPNPKDKQQPAAKSIPANKSFESTSELFDSQQTNQSDSMMTTSMNTSTNYMTTISAAGVSISTAGPTFIELRGTILPNLFKKLHKLLTVSDNADHTCLSAHLETSIPYEAVHFEPSQCTISRR